VADQLHYCPRRAPFIDYSYGVPGIREGACIT
jgi:hypothetical protein